MRAHGCSIPLLALAVISLPLVAGAVQAGELQYVLELSSSELRIETVGEYTLISFADACYDAQPGHPLVPFMARRYLLPRGLRVSRVRLEVLSIRTLSVAKPLYPAQPARPLSWEEIEFVEPLAEVYSWTVPLFDFQAELLSEGLLQGERIAAIALRPIRYVPAQGKIEVAENMVLTIEYEQDFTYDGGSVRLSAGQSAGLRQRLRGLVENPELASALTTFSAPAPDEYRHVIVTPASLVSSFQPLADWNTSLGDRDTVVSLESIDAGFSGRDLTEKIRNFVSYAHEEWGLEYLLLGGDAQLVPTRDCWVVQSGWWPHPYDTIPTDMYFGALNGDWDADGDDVFGEMNDNPDLYAEVAVGRACVDNADQVELFVDKVKAYQENPPEGFADKLMLPAEILWTNPYYPGNATNNSIANLAHPATRIARMYETQGTLSRSAVEDSLNEGVGLVHHIAHGNVIGISCANGLFITTHASNLTNAGKTPVYVSIACLVGAFDYNSPDCLVEAFQNAEEGGTVAWVGNSRYGWGTPPVRGPSEDLDVSFFETLYDKANPEAGLTLIAAKDDNAGYWGSYWVGRWCIYELNLHGDPAMPIHSREISAFIVTHDEPHAGPQTFKVTVGSEAGYPVEGMLVCVRQEPYVYAWARTDASGDAYLDINPVAGPMSLAVSGANHRVWIDNDLEARGRDLACIRIIEPVGKIEPEEITPRAVIANLGGGVDSCFAKCRITGPGAHYEKGDLEGIVYLDPGEEDDVNFPSWTPPGGPEDRYRVEVTVYLWPEKTTEDENPSNNTLVDYCTILAGVEVTATTIVAPEQDSACARTNPEAWFTSLGTLPASEFYCHSEIASMSYHTAPYHDSFYVAGPLEPGDSTNVKFASWVCSDSLLYMATFYATSATEDYLASTTMGVMFQGVPWTGIAEEPDVLRIEIAGPNPSATGTFMSYSLPEPTRVKVLIYDVTGKLVRTLHVGELSGEGSLSWDGTDDSGRRLSDGLYFIRITTPGFTRTAKIVMVR